MTKTIREQLLEAGYQSGHDQDVHRRKANEKPQTCISVSLTACVATPQIKIHIDGEALSTLAASSGIDLSKDVWCDFMWKPEDESVVFWMSNLPTGMAYKMYVAKNQKASSVNPTLKQLSKAFVTNTNHFTLVFGGNAISFSARPLTNQEMVDHVAENPQIASTWKSRVHGVNWGVNGNGMQQSGTGQQA